MGSDSSRATLWRETRREIGRETARPPADSAAKDLVDPGEEGLALVGPEGGGDHLLLGAHEVENGLEAAAGVHFGLAHAQGDVEIALAPVAGQQLASLAVNELGDGRELFGGLAVEALGMEAAQVLVQAHQPGGDEAVEQLAGLEGAHAEADGDLLD